MPLSRRAVFWWVAALLFATLPAPYYLGGVEVAPPLRLAFLAALVAGVAWTEGAHGNQLALTILALVQALLWALAVCGVSAALARALAPRRGVRAGLLGALTAALLALALLPLYATPLSSHAPRSSILGILD